MVPRTLVCAKNDDKEIISICLCAIEHTGNLYQRNLLLARWTLGYPERVCQVGIARALTRMMRRCHLVKLLNIP